MALHNIRKEIDLVLRHLKVLEVLRSKGPMGIRRISSETGIPKHQVRYSLRVLERAGALNPTSRGAMLTEKVEEYVAELAASLEDLDARLSEVLRLTRGLRGES
jgi:predicted transcriptional regulator